MPSEEPPYVSELYSAYAAGRLSAAYALMIETQMQIRADISEDVAIAEAISGAMLDAEKPSLMAPNAFEKVLQSIDRQEGSEDQSVRAAVSAGSELQELLGLPEPLRERALEACGKKGWRRLAGGIKRLDLGGSAAIHAHLYRIDPGAALPRHSHHGDEYTLVLTGGFTDASGSYGPGDIARQTPADTHKPVADDDGVCYALAISEGGIRFTGMLGILQRLIG